MTASGSRRAWLSWSSGKDSTMALAAMREDPSLADVEVVGLVTTVDDVSGRVAVHGVRRELLEAQAAALDLPLHVVALPWPCSNAEYEQRMAAMAQAARAAGVGTVVFGDLFLADVRAYREQTMAQLGLEPLFPLWGRPTGALAREMLDRGVRAVLTCVDTSRLDPSFAGRHLDEALLADLPPGVDPCGEHGEFHTFVHDGPGFARPVPVQVGDRSTRDGSASVDLLPGERVHHGP